MKISSFFAQKFNNYQIPLAHGPTRKKTENKIRTGIVARSDVLCVGSLVIACECLARRLIAEEFDLRYPEKFQLKGCKRRKEVENWRNHQDAFVG